MKTIVKYSFNNPDNKELMSLIEDRYATKMLKMEEIEAMQNKFSRRFQDKESPNFDFNIDFEVESYLDYQGRIFVDRWLAGYT